ncbi:MAG: HAMP domain-containing protein [Rhizobiales bacterium]|nr:HAMP domain-containing protein [Hyphomicrobiales bacterium]
MRRLYRKIYLTIVATLLLVVLLAGAFWRFGGPGPGMGQVFDVAGELVMAALPAAAEPAGAQQHALEHLASRLDIDLTLFGQDRRRLASVGRPLPPPPADRADGGWLYGPGGPAWSIPLPDGRWIVARAPPRHRHPAIGLVMFLGLVALAVGICAFPVVRGLTRRLERLQAGVETLGAGNLGARVKIEGRDEIAQLAESFNRAAARIEDLVASHRMLLANASHELRTPLARLRMGVELLHERCDEKYKSDIERDIAELDGLIDEILLASRLDAMPTLNAPETVDLLALAAEECAHYDECHLEGTPASVRGDPRLLRHLIRNLLENAQRHGRPPVAVTVRHDGDRATLIVADAGPGIPEAERERAFQPFQRLTGDAGGAGLGLPLVRQIARLHGGDATAAPQPGLPGAFVVTLPAADA